MALAKNREQKKFTLEQISEFYEEYRIRFGICAAQKTGEINYCSVSPVDCAIFPCRYLDTNYICTTKEGKYYSCSHICRNDA